LRQKKNKRKEEEDKRREYCNFDPPLMKRVHLFLSSLLSTGCETLKLDVNHIFEYISVQVYIRLYQLYKLFCDYVSECFVVWVGFDSRV
jgi:hypothetical protein